jgi:hypothetical protein
MPSTLRSPFAQPDPNLPIREGAPQLARPTKEEIERFPDEAQALLDSIEAEQAPLLAGDQFNLDWLEGRHILLAGATGPGVGGALASAVLQNGKAASLTVISRDLKRSLNFESGRLLEEQAQAAGWGSRFHWLNDGTALEGAPLENLLAALRETGAERVVYFNTVAAALSGLLPGMPPIYLKDVDEAGKLFQWQLKPLSEREIEITKFLMGEMAVRFPQVLAENGVAVEAAVFADWRGSLDKVSRDPEQREYGRQGAYSTSLYLPKDILQEATREAYGTDGVVVDIFYPMMRTRALPFIPGAVMLADINTTLMEKEGVRVIGVPELALRALAEVGQALDDKTYNPFPRLDSHDMYLDEWLFEVATHLNDNEDSDFYFKRWIESA